MKNIIITKDPGQTRKFGEKTAKKIIQKLPNKITKNGAVILGLSGELGSGKTTFMQGFAKGLGIKEKILSPTFVILKHFKIKNINFFDFYHIDCYRVNKPEDILQIDFESIVKNPKNIVAIEWPEKVKKYLPKEIIEVKFKAADFESREINTTFYF